MADTIVPFNGVKGFATGVTGTSIVDETGVFQGTVVTTFNGITGAVTGVNSVNGLTGAVTNITPNIRGWFLL